MKITWGACLVSVLFSVQAFAYAEKTYECRNSNEKLPANIYKIKNVRVADVTVPYIQVTRHLEGENSTVETAKVEGFASISTLPSGNQLLMVGAMRIEFNGDTLINCQD